MKSIALITKSKITADTISKLLLEKFVFSKKISQNDEHELFIGKFPNNFYIVFDDEISANDKKSLLSEEDLKYIPFENGSYNCLFFHNIEVAKCVVKIISEVYPELIIFDENDFAGKASEYIEKI